jgi:AcrR family transcriptional regulator
MVNMVISKIDCFEYMMGESGAQQTSKGKSLAENVAPAQRGRRRSSQADRVILNTTLEVLGEVGYARFTVNEVIARSGVSSATLYRRWPGKRELVTAAFESLGSESPTIDTGSLEGDLAAFVDYLGTAIAHPTELAGAWDEGIRYDPGINELVETIFVAPRRRVLVEILKNAHRRGELATVPPQGDCWSFVCGPIYHRIHIRSKAFTPAFARDTAVLLTAGLQALARSRHSP